MNANMQVTDSDIAVAEATLGLKPFDDQRREVLKCSRSVDVQACPGSGKTTVVIAKLAMLARKWPLRHQGLCVLSHTNAAREEIQSRLQSTGTAATFGYPHFVGTIQSFVDQFLGAAGAIAKFGKRPAIIDAERATRMAVRMLQHPSYSTASAWLGRRHDGDSIVAGLRFTGPSLNVVSDGGDLPSDDTRTYQDLSRLKTLLAERGAFAYADMFALAEWCLAKCPRVGAVLARRFPFVLIDEMQDTSAAQWALLSTVFAGSIIQRFGDANQAIFTGFGAEGSSGGFPGPAVLTMDNSFRFSNRIAQAVRNVCPQPHDVLRGNPDRADQNPLLILFATDKVQHVISVFAEHVLSKLGASAIKDEHGVRVVGAIGQKGAQPFCLTDYWPSFDHAAQQSNRRLENLNAYVASAKREFNRRRSFGDASAVLLQGMAEVLRIQGVSRAGGVPHSGDTILRELRTKSDAAQRQAQMLILKTCKRIAGFEAGDLAMLPTSVRDALAPFVAGGWTAEADAFLDSTHDLQDTSANPDPTTGPIVDPNVYVHKSADLTLPLKISTIHAAKGQTHLATLLVETFRRKPDLPRLIPILLGDDPSKARGDDVKRLRLAYVATTRPKSLLAIALNVDGIKLEQRQAFERAGWDLAEAT